MIYKARDGKEFHDTIRGRKYDAWLAKESELDTKEAPGGPTHKADLEEHGFVKKITISREGNGRHRVEAVHQDGFHHNSVHPEAYRAHDIARDLLGIEPPPALGTHSRSRTQPRGPKEDERIAREDGREVPEDQIP